MTVGICSNCSQDTTFTVFSKWGQYQKRKVCGGGVGVVGWGGVVGPDQVYGSAKAQAEQYFYLPILKYISDIGIILFSPMFMFLI